MMFDNVLVVAPHPDDEVLGAGGTIPLVKAAGGRVVVVIVTDGSSAQYPGDTEKLERKKTDAEAANEILGTDTLLHWDFPDMRLDTVPHVELNLAFEHLVDEHRFDTAFIPHISDANLDHELTHRAMLVASRPVPEQPLRAIFSYHTNSSTEWGRRTPGELFLPNYYVDISSTLSTKLAAMGAYRDELRNYPHPRSLEAIEDRARTFGTDVGYSAAEAFMLLRYRGSIERSG